MLTEILFCSSHPIMWELKDRYDIKILLSGIFSREHAAFKGCSVVWSRPA